jgi:hypothetical protein
MFYFILQDTTHKEELKNGDAIKVIFIYFHIMECRYNTSCMYRCATAET